MSTEDVGSRQRGILVGRGYQDDFVAGCAGDGDCTSTGLALEASYQCSFSHGASAGDYRPRTNFWGAVLTLITACSCISVSSSQCLGLPRTFI